MEGISLSRLSAYEFCNYAYFLDSIIRQDGLPMSGFEAKSTWLRREFSKLMPDERYIGIDLMPIESLFGNELAAGLKYHSPETFGNASKEGWRRYIIDKKGTLHGRKLVWMYKNQWWKTAKEIKEACTAYYEHLLRDGVPLDNWNESDATFIMKNKKIITRPGFIRRNGLIEAIEIKKISPEDFESDWTMPLKIYAVYNLTNQRAYRIKWGIKPKSVGELTYRTYSLFDGKSFEKKVSDKDVGNSITVLNGIESSIKSSKENNEFSPNLKNCATCRYSVVLLDKPVCDKKNPKIRTFRTMDELFAEAEEKKAKEKEAKQ